MNRYNINKNGFTLIELLAVIAIIAILGTIGTLATLKIYNDNIKKTMIIQENNVSSVAKTYLEDFCFDPLDNTYGCPQSYNNNTDKKYICLSNLQEKKDNSKVQDYNDSYINDVTYKKESCKGIVVFSPNDDGDYVNPKTYLYCDYDSKNKKYNYVTDESLNVSDYPICNIASGIDDSSTTTTTTTTTTKPVQTACTYNGTLKQGAEYVSGQYTYIYKKKRDGFSWVNMSEDGWGVVLTDKDSTDPVTTKLCNSINGKPIVAMSYMFHYSKAESIDLSSFDTSNVTDMRGMFWVSKVKSLDVSKFNTGKVKDMSYMFTHLNVTSIDGLSNFDTSNVTNMDHMFYLNASATLDVSSFNTSKVTNMTGMFAYCPELTSLNLNNFDTSNVTSMDLMFVDSHVSPLNLKKFNTSKVTSMNGMFRDSRATTLDLSSFDTSNVTDMSGMFWNSKVTTLKGLEKFNTSKVNGMSRMFGSTQLSTLDLRNFNTSNVTNMSEMFYNNKKLTTIYVSNSFVTSKVTSSTNMFKDSTKLVGGFGTIYSSSKIDKTYAKIDNCSNKGYFSDKINPSSFSTDSWSTIAYSVRNGNTCKYNLGDTKSVDVGTFGTHTVRVANTSTPSSCNSSSYSATACGFVIEFADIIVRYNMNPAGTYNGKYYQYGTNVGGWPASKLRTYLNNDIFKQLPSDLQSVIVNTRVVSGHGSKESSNFTSTDKLYLLSPTEVWGDWTGMWGDWSSTGSSTGNEVDTAKSSSRQLDYYVSKGTTFKNYSATEKKDGRSSYFWWHRSARYSDDIQFYGMRGYGHAYRDGGISPAFKVG